MSVARTTPPRTMRRWSVPLAIVTVLALVGSWFPFSTLLHQNGELSALQSQIALLHRQQASLQKEQRQLRSKSEETRLARQEYQLVEPGQSLIQVLSPSASGQGANAGDPGSQPVVAPQNDASVIPQTSSHVSASRSHGVSLISRILRTLEFWR